MINTAAQTCHVLTTPVDTASPSVGVNVGRETRELPGANIGAFRGPNNYHTAVQSFSVAEGLFHIPAVNNSKSVLLLGLRNMQNKVSALLFHFFLPIAKFMVSPVILRTSTGLITLWRK